MSAAGKPAVVLLHGLWLSGWYMALLGRRLRRAGFRPHRFSYPSVRRGLRENAEALRAFVDRIEGDTVHFVGHSLGGIVIRAMLGYCPPPRPGRVVTLGSPHGGSLVAQGLARRSWGPGMLGRSIGDLLRGELPPCDISQREVGVILGDVPIGLGRFLAEMPGPSDGVVLLSEGRWPGAREELVLPVAHSAMPLSREVARAVCQFLRFGHFVR